MTTEDDELVQLEQLILSKKDELEKMRMQVLTKKDELEKMRMRECIGWILSKGVPPLGNAPLRISPCPSQQKSLKFTLHREHSDIRAMRDLEEASRSSTAWKRYDTTNWQNEAVIRNRVQAVLDDCIEATTLNGTIETAPETIFPGLDTKKEDRCDLVILRKEALPCIVGAIQVMKPPNKSQALEGNEFDMNDAQQIVQYMYDIRVSYGVPFTVGILTTYVKWRFFWFEDTDAAMCETSKEGFSRMCQDSPTAPLIPETISVKKSRVHAYDDPALVPIIRSILYKWAHAPYNISCGGYLAPNRLFQAANIGENEIVFQSLPPSVKRFSYKFPFSGNVKKLYFLHVYKRSGDGKVALFSTSSGDLGVAKILISDDPADDMERKAKSESDRWRQLWEIETKVVYMLDSYVILMPFVFHMCEYSDRLCFCPFSAWNYRVQFSKLFDQSAVVQDKELEKDQRVQEYMESPLKVAREALEHMIINCGWKQPDSEVCWRHIGLIPIMPNGAPSVRPVFLDLTRLEQVEEGDRKSTFERHLKILEYAMPQTST
ncbi:MAG: hypothetical protein SGCHY_004984 [Lobulomycetales sp.]